MASPGEVLEALRVHLDPNPLVQLLPTALQLFSHIALLGETLRSEAQSALGHYEAGRGALLAQDVRLLNSCAANTWDETYRLSLDMRKSVSADRHAKLTAAHCPVAPELRAQPSRTGS